MTDSRLTISRTTTAGGPPPDRVVAAAPADSVVGFAIAGASYAVDVAIVREVVPVQRWVPVPGAPPAIAGAFALRGATLALVDTRVLFGLDATGERTTALVIARGHRALCGLTIDRVLGVARYVEAQFTPAVRGREAPLVAGFLADERNGLMTVLDASSIVRALERLRF